MSNVRRIAAPHPPAKSKDGALQRLALAISLEHAVPVKQTNPAARTDAPATVDPPQAAELGGHRRIRLRLFQQLSDLGERFPARPQPRLTARTWMPTLFLLLSHIRRRNHLDAFI